MDYRALWASKNTESSISSDVATTKRILAKYGPWLERYRGGMPLAWFALICAWESGGDATLLGDAQLGEYGLFQVAANVPPMFGLPSAARMDPESNVAIASLEYATEAIRWKIFSPDLIDLDSADVWKLARLSFAVGRGGSRRLYEAAKPTSAGDVYGDIRRWVERNGGFQLGSQDPDKVWFRVVNIELQWKIALRVAGGSMPYGPPSMIPAPPAGSYAVPNELLPYFAPASSPFAVLATGLGVIGLLVYLSRR
jgi:hypothetical protein